MCTAAVVVFALRPLHHIMFAHGAAQGVLWCEGVWKVVCRRMWCMGCQGRLHTIIRIACALQNSSQMQGRQACPAFVGDARSSNCGMCATARSNQARTSQVMPATCSQTTCHPSPSLLFGAGSLSFSQWGAPTQLLATG